MVKCLHEGAAGDQIASDLAAQIGSPAEATLAGRSALLIGQFRERGADQPVGLKFEGDDELVDAVILQDGGELRAAGRHLADRPSR